MIKVYFSCDLYFQTNLNTHLKNLIERYYSRRLELISLFPLPLIEISIVRLSKSTTTTTTTTITTTTESSSPMFDLKKTEVTIRSEISNNDAMKSVNRTVPSLHNLIVLKQIYQPLVLVPLSIIAIGLFICAIIACCLCCNRRSSSSSTLLLPSGPSGSPNNKHLYQNYSYRKYKQQQYEYRKKKSRYYDQRQFISKGKTSTRRKRNHFIFVFVL